MTDRQIMQQALEALEGAEALLLSMGLTHLNVYGDAEKAITALCERLAQPQRTHWEGCEAVHPECRKPRREWVGLTDEEKAELDAEYGDDTLAHLDAIEAKLKEKNT